MSATPEDPLSGEIEDLLVEALACFESAGPTGVEELLGRHPAHAARVRSYLGRIHRLGLVGGDSAVPHEHPERLGEFRILTVLGQGGMGVVYRAVQESLSREVALKLVRPELLFFPGARERFQREVELVARMQHPGIVPVHAVGSEGGVPYFAMELVRGATLADVLEDLGAHEAKTLRGADLDAVLARRVGQEPRGEPAPLFRGPWSEVVLRILRELAEALEHAHRRGVLHRDVKPSNVMVTREGRVLLLDFGLAGAQGAERTTRTGSQLGSLAYMAPELLAGESRELDARSDVYALGATAWELFTLRLPYASSDPLRLRQLAGSAQRPRLEEIQPGLGWDVETVVATALEPDPERRYASAAALARDLDHLLARRPIEAREIGAGLRLRRWTQRHPARATALVALALALILAPLAWAWKERDARGRVQAERDVLAATNVELEAARTQAERHLRAALDAIGHVLRSTASQALEDVPRLQRARLSAIERAQELLADLEGDRPDDAEVRLESARLAAARAEVLYDQGRFDEALASCAAARERAEAPSPAPLALDVLRLQAKILQASLRWDEAVPLQRELARARRERAAEAPSDPQRARELCQSLVDLAESLGRAQGPDPARAELVEGLALARAAAAAAPDDVDAVWLLGRVNEDRAEAELLAGDPARAAAAARESVEAYRAAAALDAEARFREANVASALGLRARIEHALGQDARASYAEGIAILEGLAREFPEAVRYRLDQARLLDEQAHSLRFRDPPAAVPLHRASIALFDALLVEQPDRCQLRFAAAVAHNNWANHQIHVQRDFSGALASGERTVELIGACAERTRADVQLAQLAWRSAYLHALALCLDGRPEPARREIEAFAARAGEDALRWRYTADLWCEWTLAQERGGASAALVEEGRGPLFDALGRAVELGYRDLQELRSTPALQRFRDDPELAALLADLERGG